MRKRVLLKNGAQPSFYFLTHLKVFGYPAETLFRAFDKASSSIAGVTQRRVFFP